MSQVTYPGVYIKEVPSGVRTIAGVPTSITAFIGRAVKGPVNNPTTVFSYGDYNRIFGGLSLDSTMSYAVRDYFTNGGGQAIIVRIAATSSQTDATLDLSTAAAGTWSFTPALSGAAGNNIRVTVTSTPDEMTVEEVDDATSSSAVVLNQAVYDSSSAANLTAALAADTSLLELDGTAPADEPSDIADKAFTGGLDVETTASVVLTVASGTLALQAAAAGTDGNDITITVIHSLSSSTKFALIVETDTPAEREVYENMEIGSLAAALTAATSIIEVSGSAPSARPAEVSATTFSGGDAATKASASFTAPTSNLTLVASTPGGWGNELVATVDHDVIDSAGNPGPNSVFNLTIEQLDSDKNLIAIESFRNLSTDSTATRYIDNVLNDESDLVSLSGAVQADRPAAVTRQAFAGGATGGALSATDFEGSEAGKTGLYALENADIFNLLCVPPFARTTDVTTGFWATALAYCKKRRSILLVDPPVGWTDWSDVTNASTGVDGLNLRDENAAVYFPRIRAQDPLKDNMLETFVPCGAVAGVIARTDGNRGIWKAPAGTDAIVKRISGPSVALTNDANGQLNPLGVNCIRTIPAAGNVIWGARTLEGADRLGSEWKYLSVRRVALYIEESLYRGTHWAVFEPNDEPLWAQLRLNVGAFMNGLFRKGAFQGTKPSEAYFVKCDSETTTQNDINLGIVNVHVGFAPLKPAEFVVISIQQIAGQLDT